MIRLLLNRAIPGNYVFCDPEARVHLSMSQPAGNAFGLTKSILRAVRGKTVIDVDGVIDLEKGELKLAEPTTPVAPVSTVVESVDVVVEPIKDETQEATVDTATDAETPAEEPKAKRSKKK